MKDEFEDHTLPCNISCSTLDVEEHCDGKDGMCKCGNGKSCLRTETLCVEGQCIGMF